MAVEEYDVVCVGAGFGSIATLARYVASEMGLFLRVQCSDRTYPDYGNSD